MPTEPLAWHVCAKERDVKHQREQQKHERQAETAAEQHTVKQAIAAARILARAHTGHRDLLGAQRGGGGQHIVHLLGGHALGRGAAQRVQRGSTGQRALRSGLLQHGGIADGRDLCRRACVGGAAHRTGQLRQAIPSARGAGNDRDAKLGFERIYVDLDVLFARFVHQIQT